MSHCAWRTSARNWSGRWFSDDLGEIEHPTLLIWGKEDVVTPPSAGQGFTELMPNAELFWIENCGHAPMIEAPEPFAEAMHAFFDKQGYPIGADS